MGVLAGIFLIISDRATEITFGRLGTIKAAAQQAASDASHVAEIKGRIDGHAAAIEAAEAKAKKAAELSEELTKAVDSTQARLADLNLAIANSREETTRALQQAEFLDLVVAAYNDSREAYDRLRELSSQNDYPFAAQASHIATGILFAHSKPKPKYVRTFDKEWIERELSAPTYEGFSPLSAIKKKYEMTTPQFRPELMEYLWNHAEIETAAKVEFLLDVMKTDKSLSCVEHAGVILAEEHLRTPIKPLMVLDVMRGNKKRFRRKQLPTRR